MGANSTEAISEVVYSVEFERAIQRWKEDRTLFRQIESQMAKILREPNTGKPLRYSLKGRRRVHVGSFVVVYEFHNAELRFIDFDHHDRVYKKYHAS